MDRTEKILSSWEPLWDPESVAVVGASNIPGKWGFIIPMNLVMGGFAGKLFMVNPNEKNVQGLPTVKSLSAIGEKVDLVCIMVPAPYVADVIEECPEVDCRNAVIISSGFSEMSDEGKRMEVELTHKAREKGVRIIGPNTMGICSPPTNLFAMGSFTHPPAGHVAFLSQSGNLGVQLLGWAARSGLGISRFVGSGNEAQVMCDHVLEFFGADPRTKVIIMYIEGIDHGQRFLEIARSITPHKPIIALKMGATKEGAKAAASHSGAVSTSHRVYEAMVKQAGIIQASSTEEMVNLARTFGYLPIPKGKRVGIMTMGGGWGVVTTEALAREGLKLPPPSDATIEAVNQVLPEFWSHGNPVDLVGTIRRSAHYVVLESMVRDPNFDSIITLGSLTGMQFSRDYSRGQQLKKMAKELFKRHGLGAWRFDAAILSGIWRSYKASKKKTRRGKMQMGGGIDFREARKWSDEVFAREIKRFMRASGKPIVPVPFDPGTVADIFKQLGLVAFRAPEEAVTAIAKLTDYHLFLERHRNEMERDEPTAAMDDTAIAITTTLKGKSKFLSEHESKTILTHYGIDVTKETTASTEEEAVAAALDIGFPVVVKVDSVDIAHKSDAGCVITGVRDEQGVRAAYNTVMKNARAYSETARVDGVLVQEMVEGGTEVMVGVSSDPHYGKTIVFGLGGVFVEVLDDVALRILPIEIPDAEHMIEEIKGKKILEGARGQKRRDIPALAETIRRIGELGWDLRERVVEMDVNPLVVFEEGKGVKALDALMVLGEKQEN